MRRTTELIRDFKRNQETLGRRPTYEDGSVGRTI